MRRPRASWRANAPIGLAALVFVLGGAACGGDGSRSARELEADTLVRLRVGEDVTCRDNHAVNTKLVPNATVTFICHNANDDIYVATISPEGELMSLSGRVHLKRVS